MDDTEDCTYCHSPQPNSERIPKLRLMTDDRHPRHTGIEPSSRVQRHAGQGISPWTHTNPEFMALAATTNSTRSDKGR